MSEQKIFDLYQSLNLWTNSICQQCKTHTRDLSGPVGIWQVGRDYKNDPYKLIFVGKTARGTVHANAEAELRQQGYINGTNEADEWICQKWSAYWSYTAAIVEKIYCSLEQGWECVAFTNLIKCNNSMDVDTTNREVATNCLEKLGVTWREFDILQPRNVVMFTGSSYDNFIEQYSSRFKGKDITQRNHQVCNGKKMMLWWERHCVYKSGHTFRILRTSHPERQRKETFVARIAEWVKNGEAV